MHLLHIFRAPFYKNTSEGLLLEVIHEDNLTLISESQKDLWEKSDKISENGLQVRNG